MAENEYTLEKLKIHERLATLTERIDTHIAREEKSQEEDRKAFREFREELRGALYGNGHKGLRDEVNDLKRTARSGIWIAGIIGATVSSIITAFAKDVIAERHKERQIQWTATQGNQPYAAQDVNLRK